MASSVAESMPPDQHLVEVAVARVVEVGLVHAELEVMEEAAADGVGDRLLGGVRRQRGAHARGDLVHQFQAGAEREPERRLDQAVVDARRQEVGVVGGVRPVEEGRGGERDREAPGEGPPGPPRPAPGERQVQGQAREPQQRAVDEAPAQYGAEGERQAGVEKEDQSGEMQARQGPGGEAAPEDRQTAARQTMKIGRSIFWWKCHG